MPRVSFCTAPDGLGLAYGAHGSGPPIVKAANWMTHLEHDWQSPVWRHWLEALGENHTLIRYDERGCGLSDRDVDEDAFTFERWVSDLESVVDAAAARPLRAARDLAGRRAGDRVRRAPPRAGQPSRPLRRLRARPRCAATKRSARSRRSWSRRSESAGDEPNAAFRRLFTTLFLPGATPEQMAWYDELQRLSASPETAARIWQARAVRRRH